MDDQAFGLEGDPFGLVGDGGPVVCGADSDSMLRPPLL
jgi:hypothetical protein